MERHLLPRDRTGTVLLVVDIQERLCAAMPAEVLGKLRRYTLALLAASKELGLPVLLTEQYPRGLGKTLPDIAAALPAGAPVEKLTFSSYGAPALRAALESTGRRHVIVCGMETHVCVYQTARDLVAAGYEVSVPQDAVCSRTKANWRVGLRLMERAGAEITSTETVLFDLLGQAGTPEFKAISALIK